MYIITTFTKSKILEKKGKTNRFILKIITNPKIRALILKELYCNLVLYIDSINN